MSSLEDRLRTIVREAPSLNTVLKVARALALPDWMIFSGAVYQPVWNSLTGRSPEHGLSEPKTAVSFKTSSNTPGKLSLGAQTPDMLVYATAEGLTGTFALSQPDVSAFLLPLIESAAVAPAAPPAPGNPAPIPTPATPPAPALPPPPAPPK